MFRRLRNRLILINFIITTIILVIAFLIVYLVARNSADRRPLPPKNPEFSVNESEIINKHVREERKESLNSLVISLIFVGIIVEFAVITFSYLFAEIAIRPIRENYETQKNFIANASHEMKTPLAIIATNLEAADIKNNHWIENAAKEVDLLTSMNQELLMLASAENLASAQAESQIVDPEAIINEILESFQAQLREKKLQIKVNPNATELKLVASDLRQVLRILLDNAIKYGKSKITVEYNNREFKIENDGKKIPAKNLRHVFDRFYQVDKTMNGAGLGLAIAKALAERNNWKLAVASDKNTTFILKV